MAMTRSIASLCAAFALIAAACTDRGRQPPLAVVSAEGLAEDIQTDMDTSGWTAARAKLDQLQASRSALRKAVSDSLKNAEYGAALDSLAAQVERRDRLASLLSANRMSRVLLAISADYELTVPVQVGLLDVAGRDAIYWAEAGDWRRALIAVAQLWTQYAAVQDHIAAKNAALNGRVAQQLAALEAAISTKNATRVRAVATGLLDDVDLVERTY
jgi:hypothetical protein